MQILFPFLYLHPSTKQTFASRDDWYIVWCHIKRLAWIQKNWQQHTLDFIPLLLQRDTNLFHIRWYSKTFSFLAGQWHNHNSLCDIKCNWKCKKRKVQIWYTFKNNSGNKNSTVCTSPVLPAITKQSVFRRKIMTSSGFLATVIITMQNTSEGLDHVFPQETCCTGETPICFRGMINFPTYCIIEINSVVHCIKHWIVHLSSNITALSPLPCLVIKYDSLGETLAVQSTIVHQLTSGLEKYTFYVKVVLCGPTALFSHDYAESLTLNVRFPWNKTMYLSSLPIQLMIVQV